MPREIERKFLMKDASWRAKAGRGVELIQGYLPTKDKLTARVRLAGKKAWLTIKGPSQGMARDEYEYAIPVKDARELLARYCGRRVVAKTRYRLGPWEVDEFSGRHRGLVVAEIELRSTQAKFKKPDWLGREVTGRRRYDNSALADAPRR